ncbi:MAG: potassium ABC transporter ATPase [Pseudomonadota bacterium]
MDFIYLGTIALFYALTGAFASGCEKLGGKQ